MIQYKLYDWRFDAEKFSRDISAYRPEFSDAMLADVLGIEPTTMSTWRHAWHTSSKFKFPSMSNFIRVCNELDLDPREYFCLIDE